MSQVLQPLHPSIIQKLDPEYRAFHDSTLAYLTPVHTIPWDPSLRYGPAVPGGSAPLSVGKVQDFDLTHTKFRAFTPPGDRPTSGWPVFIFFHGGQRHRTNHTLSNIPQVDGPLGLSILRIHSSPTCVLRPSAWLSLSTTGLLQNTSIRSPFKMLWSLWNGSGRMGNLVLESIVPRLRWEAHQGAMEHPLSLHMF